jgi:hypothetical protein
MQSAAQGRRIYLDLTGGGLSDRERGAGLL